MNTFAIINIAKKQLGMHEDDYRALLKQTTGKDSLRAMTEKQRIDVVEALKGKGFKTKKTKKPYSNKPYVRLIYALWKSVHAKGMIDDGSRSALRSFVENQAGVSDPEFLTNEQATPIIEALKAIEHRGMKPSKKSSGG